MDERSQNILRQIREYQLSQKYPDDMFGDTFGPGFIAYVTEPISTANTKFKDFNNVQANLGSSITFDLPQ